MLALPVFAKRDLVTVEEDICHEDHKYPWVGGFTLFILSMNAWLVSKYRSDY